MKSEELKTALSQFIGTENYYKYYGNFLLTDGVKFLCEEAGAYWLIDILWSVQMISKVRNEGFQVLKLKVDVERSKGVVEISDGNNNIVYTQEIEYTDFPLEEITIWAIEQGEYRIILLPSEY
jgi:hypothetical protein